MKGFAVRLTSGATVFRDSRTPSPGEVFEAIAPVDRPWADGRGERFDWTTQTIVDDLATLTDQLAAQINAERERRQMLVLTPGGAKKMVYNAKADEVEQWNRLNVVGATTATILTAIAGLSLGERKRRFRYAMRDAAIRNEPTIAPAILRFAAGADASNDESARIEAIAQKAISAVKAASTAAAKRAAYAAINWSWNG